MSRYPQISPDLAVQAHYETCRRNGCNDNLAKILALRQPPATRTDREFFRGVGTLADQFSGAEDQLDEVVRRARARGYEPGVNDFYSEAVADDIGDPKGFIRPTDGRQETQRRYDQRMLEMAAAAQSSDAGPPIAREIIDREVGQQIARDPGLATKRTQIEEDFINRHAVPSA